MSVREKLIELLDETFDKQYDRNLVITARNTADHLISNGVTLQKWIPVSERLPEHGAIVLCHMSFDVATMQWDGHSRLWVSLFSDYEVNVVTHWMPLPEPPKECE